MSMTVVPNQRHRARRHLLTLAALVAVMLALATLLTIRLTHRSGPGTAARPAPSATHTSDVSWVQVAGVDLPVSPQHGPRVIAHGRAAGYSRSPQGAAIAAVQILARTSATAGPDIYRPVLTSQVTGANLAELTTSLDAEYERLRAQHPVAYGEPIPGNDATVVGYLLTAYDTAANSASVDVVLSSQQLKDAGQLVAFTVSLAWANDDWRVYAPPDGDWSSLARTLGATPPGLLDYRAI